MITLDINHLDYQKAIHNFLSKVESFTKVECKIHFLAEHNQSKIIRDIIGIIFDKNNVSAPWRGRFVLIADELINNAIEHGSRPEDIDYCIIRSHTTKKGAFTIEIEVHDTGNGKDSTDLKRMCDIQEKGQPDEQIYMGKRGRGLFYITAKLVDTLTFSESPNGGLAVKIKKMIKSHEILASK